MNETDTTGSFPTSKYQLEVDPSAFFSIIFVDTTLSTPTDPRTLNYTFFGQNDYTLVGEWKDLTFTFMLEEESISLPLTTFVCYQSSPESGVQGSLGIAQSMYN